MTPATIQRSVSTPRPLRPAAPQPPRRKRRREIWLLPAVAVMLLLAPVVLLAGAANPPCAASGPTAVSTPAGVPGARMFAAPLQLAPGHWYRVGATRYGGPSDPSSSSWGSSGAYLPSLPDSFAELSVLDSNPANGGTFTSADANALNNLPYGTSLRVVSAGRQLVLAKRDIGYGQGPGQAIAYRIDVWWQAASPLGISKTPVALALAPSSGAAATLGQLPQPAAAPASGSSGCATATSGPLTLTPGQTAQIRDGVATAPADAPGAVKLAIAAGNHLIDKPYQYGGGHGQPLTMVADSYDCSSSTSYVLHAAGLFGAWPEDSTQLESYGQAGPGRWITVYANSAHAFIEVAGIVMDTAWYAPVQPTTPGSGPRWQPASIIAAQYAGDQQAGNGGFVQRHPEGL